MSQVQLKRTPLSMMEYARALLRAWRGDFGVLPTKKAAGVLWAQYMIETGGAACWNFNLGNVKVTPGQVLAGVSWVDLPGTWEIIGGKRVVLPEGDQGRRFRAFESLEEAMVGHLRFLHGTRYGIAWPAVEAGDCDAFARRLKAAGYFTAPAEQYAEGMRGHHIRWMASPVYEAVVHDILIQMEEETQPELPNPASAPTVYAPEMAIVHDSTEAVDAAVEDYRKRRDDDEPA